MTSLFDAHDDQERAEVRALLEKLPEEHVAWTAHREGADALQLTHLVGEPDLIEKLRETWLGGYGRMLRQTEHFRP